MRCFQSNTNDTFINLATEEFLLDNCVDDVFILYINQPSVIVGKHQNAFAEIDYAFVKQNNISVARRITGGGTVYHDFGNLNFAFICRKAEVNFEKHTLSIINALKKLGIDATFGGHHSILIGDKKISGNAEHLHKNKTLHHGTLLFETNLDNLEKSLKPVNQTFNDKAVKSVKATVTNISEHLSSSITINQFSDFIFDNVRQYFGNSFVKNLTENEIERIEKLADKKYRQWKWIYGYSPKFQRVNSIGKWTINFSVENGIIKQMDLKNDSTNYQPFSNSLIGCELSEQNIKLKFDNFIEAVNLSFDEFIKLTFC